LIKLGLLYERDVNDQNKTIIERERHRNRQIHRKDKDKVRNVRFSFPLAGSKEMEFPKAAK
jgi:hypothetical protein